MSRVIGGINRSNNYEVNVRKPLDARSLVSSYEDLTIKENWFDGKKVTAYNGMLVSVANTSDTSKNGLYMLFDINCTSALKSPNVTVETNWIKIGENSDIYDFVTRIESIEESILNLTTDVSSLDARITALENDEDTLHTYGYRSLFPVEGIDGHMYVAVDEHKTYVWYNNDYAVVGESLDNLTTYTYILDGGSAD